MLRAVAAITAALSPLRNFCVSCDIGDFGCDSGMTHLRLQSKSNPRKSGIIPDFGGRRSMGDRMAFADTRPLTEKAERACCDPTLHRCRGSDMLCNCVVAWNTGPCGCDRRGWRPGTADRGGRGDRDPRVCGGCG